MVVGREVGGYNDVKPCDFSCYPCCCKFWENVALSDKQFICMSTVNRAISLQKYFIMISWAVKIFQFTGACPGSLIQWYIVVLGGLPSDLSRSSNYQVLHKLSVIAGLFVGCSLVIMKSLSRQTNIMRNHIIVSSSRGHPIITRDNYYSSDCIPVYQHSTTTSVFIFLPSDPLFLFLSKSTLLPSQQNLISITKISPQIIWHLISWRKK